MVTSIHKMAILAAMFGLLVASCALPNSSVVATSAQLPSDPDFAVAVIGQTSIGTLLANESCPNSLSANWSSVGRSDGIVRRFSVRDIQCVEINQPAARDFALSRDFSPLPTKYTVLRLRPGNYRLDEVTHFRGFGSQTRTPIVDTRPIPRGWIDMTVPRFTVAAGEVVHVGTLVYLRVEPVNLRATANLAQAREALRQIWPEGAERMIERRMLVGPPPAQP